MADALKSWSIVSCNVGKRAPAMVEVLTAPYDILCIQEPNKEATSGLSFSSKARTFAGTWAEPRALIHMKDFKVKAHLIPQLSDRDSVTVKIGEGPEGFLITSTYCDGKKDRWPDSFTKTLDYAHTNNLTLVATMDSNAHSVLWGYQEDLTQRDRFFTETILEEGGMVLNHQYEPTFISHLGETAIDVIVLFQPNRPKVQVKNCRVLTHKLPADHRPIEAVIETVSDIATTELKLDYQKTNWKFVQDSIHNELADFETQPITVISEQILETASDRLLEAIFKQFGTTIPYKESLTEPFQGWFNDKCKTWQKRFRKAEKALRYAKNPSKKREYRERLSAIRRRYGAAIQQARKESFQRMVAEVDDCHAMAKLNKLLIKKREERKELSRLEIDGQVLEDDDQILTAMAEVHFPGSLPETPPAEPRTQKFLLEDYRCITKEKIIWCIRQFKDFKAPGPDGIQNKILTQLPAVALNLLKVIYTGSLQLGYVPRKLRASTVIFIPKP